MKLALPDDRKNAIDKRGAAIRKDHESSRDATMQAAAIAWDASPISTARLCAEIYAQIKDLDWSLVPSSGNVSGWPKRLWSMEKYYHWTRNVWRLRRRLWCAGLSRRARLPTATKGRFSVSIQSDGDLMYAPGALWTAARHKILLLAVMHNNRGYHQEVMHVQRLANFRNRVASTGGDLGPVGTSIMNPGHRISQTCAIDGLVG